MSALWLLVLAAVCMSVATAQLGFDYNRQDTWPDNCNNPAAMRQTPINIVTSDVVVNDTLVPIEFDDRWTASLSGSFANNGANVRFVDSGQRARVRHHLGEYELFNFHLHWGPTDDNGTGHQIDGRRFGTEFHYVMIKVGANISNFGPDIPEDTVAVISVLAEAADIPIDGPWGILNPTLVPNATNSINVTGISYPMVLPENRDYFYYPGSQTSPGCYEFVHWFVMRDTIPVPREYLEKLRMTRFDTGELILLNRRNIQPIFDRVVSTPPSGAVGVVSHSVLVVSSTLLACGLLLLNGGL